MEECKHACAVRTFADVLATATALNTSVIQLVTKQISFAGWVLEFAAFVAQNAALGHAHSLAIVWVVICVISFPAGEPICKVTSTEVRNIYLELAVQEVCCLKTSRSKEKVSKHTQK
jgi:hypothetical protein